LFGDLNIPGFDWKYSLPSGNCHFCTKLTGGVIHSITCFLGLNQHNYPDSGCNLLDLDFLNFADLSFDHAEIINFCYDFFWPSAPQIYQK
jgi:hypothetical protein